jgi:hypothetical protein
MKKTAIMALLVVTAIIMSDCRKGEDDPALSFRTRKGRVAGEWIMTSGSEKYITSDGNPITTETFEFLYTELGYTSNYSISGPGTNTAYPGSGKHQMKINFERDGRYSIMEMIDGDFYTETGVWNFVKGIGEYKNKEQITLTPKFISGDGRFSQRISTKKESNFTFVLKELRHRSMVLTFDESVTENITNSTGGIFYPEIITTKMEWVLEQPKKKDREE